METGISKDEILMINTYALSELGGSLFLGKKSRITNDPDLKLKLIWHSGEEMRHTLIFYNLMRKLNIPFLDLHNEKNEGYWSYVEKQKDLIYYLALAHLREMRLPFHFTLHSRWTEHKEIKLVLERLVKEEVPHLAWMRKYLIREKNKGNDKVLPALKKAFDFEKKYYDKEIKRFEKMSKGDGKILAKDILKKKGEFEYWIKEVYLKKWFPENDNK